MERKNSEREKCIQNKKIRITEMEEERPMDEKGRVLIEGLTPKKCKIIS
jgi:hypothetical protein